MPRCLCCNEKFEKKYKSQQGRFKFCLLKEECIAEWRKVRREYEEAENKKAWNKEKKARKEALKTRGDYLKELQTIFNRWIRLRDQGEPCISCQKPCKKENAGHFQAVNKKPELRFEPLNVHLQCEYCNTYLHGNLIDYRINLIKKIGLEKVEWLEGYHEPKNYTIDQIKGLKVMYKLKIKNLKQNK